MKNYIRPSKEDFIRFYSDHSGVETAKHFNISRPVVSKYARQYNLPRRSFTYKEITHKPATRQMEIIAGSLLGDGCLEAVDTPKCNSRFMEKHGMAQVEYLQWKCNELKPFTTGVKFGSDYAHEIKDHRVPKKDFCVTRTYKHPIFTELEKRWYDNTRIKHIPEDLTLTPLMLSVWFLDDGHNSKNGGIFIYTNGFSLDEVKLLVVKLRGFGIKNCHERQNQESRGSKPEVYIEKSSCNDFIKMVKNQIQVECMAYKLKEQK